MVLPCFFTAVCSQDTANGPDDLTTNACLWTACIICVPVAEASSRLYVAGRATNAFVTQYEDGTIHTEVHSSSRFHAGFGGLGMKCC